MSRRLTTVLRIFAGLALAVVLYGAGTVVPAQIPPDLLGLDPTDPDVTERLEQLSQFLAVNRLLISVSFGLMGLAFGYVLAPPLVKPFTAVYEELREVPPSNVMGGTIGLAIGLLLAALLAIPLHFLPPPWGLYLPFIVALALGYLGVAIMGTNPGIYLNLLQTVRGGSQALATPPVLLDTSVIIDGRVGEVAETGFLGNRLVVPRFVLAELQTVADSSDSLRRARGRRGLEVLNRLQQSETVRVEINDTDYPDTTDVDRKLIRLAEETGAAVMTNDYNLNRVADIQGIRVLNLNELANAVKTLLLPGEMLRVAVIQEGKEYGQGVGYLEDGTMVVIEGGRPHIGETLDVTVTRVLQTVAGRMIFAGMVDDDARNGSQPNG